MIKYICVDCDESFEPGLTKCCTICGSPDIVTEWVEYDWTGHYEDDFSYLNDSEEK
jgi:hypothetical protein